MTRLWRTARPTFKNVISNAILIILWYHTLPPYCRSLTPSLTSDRYRDSATECTIRVCYIPCIPYYPHRLTSHMCTHITHTNTPRYSIQFRRHTFVPQIPQNHIHTSWTDQCTHYPMSADIVTGIERASWSKKLLFHWWKTCACVHLLFLRCVCVWHSVSVFSHLNYIKSYRSSQDSSEEKQLEWKACACVYLLFLRCVCVWHVCEFLQLYQGMSYRWSSSQDSSEEKQL